MSEADNWLAALRTATREHRFDEVVATAGAMSWFANGYPHWGHWTEVFTLGSTAAEELGDAATIATQLTYLSWSLNTCDGDSAAAAATAGRAYAAAMSADDVRQQGVARYYQAAAQFAAGSLAAAFDAAQEALRLAQRASDPAGLSLALGMVGRGHEKLGRVDEALESHRQRLAVVTDPSTALHPAVAAASALSARATIGRLHKNRGDWNAAAQALRPILKQGDTVAIPRLHAVALAGLGEALCETGQRAEGIKHLRAAQGIHQRLKNEPETARLQVLLGKYTVD